MAGAVRTPQVSCRFVLRLRSNANKFFFSTKDVQTTEYDLYPYIH